LETIILSDASYTAKKVLTVSEIVKIEHLKKYFPVQKGFLEQMFARKRTYVKAVDDVSFSVKKGEIFTLARACFLRFLFQIQNGREKM
jgi:ABC-type glutathione transport system ATPase component